MTLISGRPRPRRRAVVLAVLGFVLLVAGCSSSAVEPAGLTASPTPSPTDTASAAAKEKAAVLDVYQRYWAASVAAQRGNPDPALFRGIADGPIVEEALIEAKQFKENGMVREGKPGFSKITVEVDGTAATVSACVDFRSWVVPDAEGVKPSVLPGGILLQKTGTTWLVVKDVDAGHGLTC